AVSALIDVHDVELGGLAVHRRNHDTAERKVGDWLQRRLGEPAASGEQCPSRDRGHEVRPPAAHASTRVSRQKSPSENSHTAANRGPKPYPLALGDAGCPVA